MAVGHDQEELLNGRLAELLVGQGLAARAERREGGRRMDVVVDVGGARVVLEAEAGFSAAKRKEAIGDADRRLKQGLTTVVFAVCYPDGSTTDSLAQAKPIWTVRTRSELGGGAGGARWSEPGGVPELAEAIRQAGGAVGDADGAAQILSEALDAAVQRLSTPARRALAQEMDLPRTKVKPGSREDGYFTAAKRAMLVVATAMLFHHRLQEHLPAVRPSGYAGDWSPANPAQCAAEPETTVGAFLEAWRAILAVDYRPVFETARVALLALPQTPDIAQAVFTLAGEVGKIAGLVHGLRHDLLGRIFHRVLDTARYDGSFYTSTPAAVLLAALAIREEDCDWSDANAVERLRICDPACGTGTLLMAAAERIRDLRQRAGPIAAEDEQLLALALVENVLWGYDINLTATHMAASTLGMLSPSTKFGRMNIHRTLLGVYEGTPYLGSLEFLTGQPRLAAWPSISQQVDDDRGGEPPEHPPAMDLVIMNPPFTRDSLRHDQFSRDDELQIKKLEKGTLEGQPHRAAARLHSSGGMFAVLAERMLKSNAGTLALILPSVVPTAPGNLALRTYLAERCHVDTIVSSHDPERINMSENTNIGEALIICRRWDSDDLKPPTRFINFAVNPDTAYAAQQTANQIVRGSTGDFTTQWASASRIERGDWNAVNFFAPRLTSAWRSLADEAAGHYSDPIRSDPIRSDPIRSDPIRSDPIRSDPIRSDPIRSDPIRDGFRYHKWRLLGRTAVPSEAHSTNRRSQPKRAIGRCGITRRTSPSRCLPGPMSTLNPSRARRLLLRSSGRVEVASFCHTSSGSHSHASLPSLCPNVRSALSGSPVGLRTLERKTRCVCTSIRRSDCLRYSAGVTTANPHTRSSRSIPCAQSPCRTSRRLGMMRGMRLRRRMNCLRMKCCCLSRG